MAAAFAAAVAGSALGWWARRCYMLRAQVPVLRQTEARFRALVQHASDVTLIVDGDGIIRYASPSASAAFHLPSRLVEGTHLVALVHPEDEGQARRAVGVRGGGAARETWEWRVLGATGEWRWTENTTIDLTDEPSVGGVVVQMRDVSERRALETRLTHEAMHDGLTRLANRSLFLNRVAHALARGTRRARPEAAVLFLDLDDFKKVNDSLGHGAGDELLIAGAARLAACVRPGDTIARFGGDEFAVLLEGIDDLAHAVQIAERMAEALRAPFRMQGRDVFIGASIGIAAVEPGDAPDDVLRNADLAMYVAKGREGASWAIYAPEMHRQVLDRLELEADLRRAVDQGHIRVVYQPIVRLDTGAIVGMEALVRWQHPSRGDVSPARFIPLAEETGLVVPIGRQVLHAACAQAQAWQRPGEPPLRIAVNLSGRHFQEPSLHADVAAALADSGLPPSALTLEITESVLMHRSEATRATLHGLKGLGLQLAIDDFGTGYSSLGYLQQFPIDILKIDRSFVEAVGTPGSDPVLARAILALGETLRLQTVAEGIERPEQREELQRLGCTLGQGYLFSRPVDAGAMSALLEASRAAARGRRAGLHVVGGRA